jgi:hypothetical protein
MDLDSHLGPQRPKYTSQQSQVPPDRYPARLLRLAQSNLAQTSTELMAVIIRTKLKKGLILTQRADLHNVLLILGVGLAAGRIQKGYASRVTRRGAV